MAVTFAVLTTHPALLPCQLLRLSPQVHLHPRDERSTTVGLGAASEDALLLRRYAPAEAPSSLADSAFADEAGALLYRSEALSPSASPEETGQPLRLGRWLFAQAGGLESWPLVQAWAESELPPHLLTQVGTRTLGAAAFALFLRGMRPLARTDQAVSAEDGARLLRQVARELAQRAVAEGAVRAARLLLVAADVQHLLVARLGEAPVYFRLLEGSPECLRCQLGPVPRGRESAARAHQQARAVVVSTSPEPSAHWLELLDGQALAVGPSVAPVVL